MDAYIKAVSKEYSIDAVTPKGIHQFFSGIVTAGLCTLHEAYYTYTLDELADLNEILLVKTINEIKVNLKVKQRQEKMEQQHRQTNQGRTSPYMRVG